MADNTPVPPKSRPVVFVPVPPKAVLATFKSLTSVQLVPFQDSVLAVVPPGALPPDANAAV